MTEEKPKSIVELENIKKKAQVVGAVGLILLVLGLGAMVFAVLSATSGMYPDNEHITDQGMPVRDLENATYTWTADEITDMAQEKLNLVLIGGFVAAIGMAIFYSVAVIEPSKEKLHEIGCQIEEYGPTKYCPECGYKNPDKK